MIPGRAPADVHFAPNCGPNSTLRCISAFDPKRTLPYCKDTGCGDQDNSADSDCIRYFCKEQEPPKRRCPIVLPFSKDRPPMDALKLYSNGTYSPFFQMYQT